MTTREFLNAYSRITSNGWLSIGEALLLVTYAEMTEGPIVEVGSYQGRSTMLLAQLPSDEGHLLNRKIYCIDPWDNNFHSELKGDEILSRFLANVRTITNSWVVPIRTRVEEWEPLASEFVYLDGDHTYLGTLDQIKQVLRCKPRYIAIHDVAEEGGGQLVKRAAEDLLGKWTERIEHLAVWEIRQ